MDLPHVHAGAVYYNTKSAGPVLAKFRSDTEHAFANYDRLGFKSLFRQRSKVLEILYSYAFAKVGRCRVKPEFARMDYDVVGVSGSLPVCDSE
jgi:hypothetical protein